MAAPVRVVPVEEQDPFWAANPVPNSALLSLDAGQELDFNGTTEEVDVRISRRRAAAPAATTAKIAAICHCIFVAIYVILALLRGINSGSNNSAYQIGYMVGFFLPPAIILALGIALLNVATGMRGSGLRSSGATGVLIWAIVQGSLTLIFGAWMLLMALRLLSVNSEIAIGAGFRGICFFGIGVLALVAGIQGLMTPGEEAPRRRRRDVNE